LAHSAEGFVGEFDLIYSNSPINIGGPIMAGMKLKIELRGSLEDNEQVRFEEFVGQLEDFKEALRHTDRIISKKDNPTVFYRIIELSYHSPATMTIAAYPCPGIQEDNSDEVVRTISFGIKAINEKSEVPSYFDHDALEAYKGIGKRIGKGFSSITVSANGDSCTITEDFPEHVQLVQGKDEITIGSISGKIEAINFHSPPYRFTIYPLVGPNRVRCVFKQKLKKEALAAIDKYVTVYGRLKYRQRAVYPYEIDVDNIITGPPPDKIAKLSDLKGMAPNITDGLSSEEYIRKLRDLDG
jgi:hypothetical protein